MIKKNLRNFLYITIISICLIFMFVLLNDQFTNMNYFKTVNSNQISNLISQKEEVTIYFYKNNCQPCAVQKDILNSLVKNNEYEIYGVNIESYDGKSYDIIRKYNIKYTPTFIKYKLGVYSERKEGLVDKKELIDFLTKRGN